MKASASSPLEGLARFGYGARCAVYCLVGGLALPAAFASGARTHQHLH